VYMFVHQPCISINQNNKTTHSKKDMVSGRVLDKMRERVPYDQHTLYDKFIFFVQTTHFSSIIPPIKYTETLRINGSIFCKTRRYIS
jgi:hypothetical protein